MTCCTIGNYKKFYLQEGTPGIMARLALLSVSNKTNIINLARTLVEEFDFDIISSGGTAKTLKNAGIPVNGRLLLKLNLLQIDEFP